jgi:hypothetical protein
VCRASGRTTARAMCRVIRLAGGSGHDFSFKVDCASYPHGVYIAHEK